jgi:hypothetical protein
VSPSAKRTRAEAPADSWTGLSQEKLLTASHKSVVHVVHEVLVVQISKKMDHLDHTYHVDHSHSEKTDT